MLASVVLLAFLAQAAPAQQAQTGVAPEWDTPKLFAALVDHSKKIQPLLQQVKPQDWTLDANAKEAWVNTWKIAVQNNFAVVSQAQAVAPTPGKIPESMQLLLAVERAQGSLYELLEGVRKYQNPALAELIAGMEAEGKPALEAYEQRVLDLVNEHEEQCATADHEAQRCREMLSKRPRASH